MLQLSYIEFVPVTQNMRELLLCLMTSLHVKNNLKCQKCRKRGGVNAKRAVEEQSKEFIKKKKKKICDFEYNLIMRFM